MTVDGLDGGERGARGPNPVRLVHGSCAQPGAVAFRLNPLRGPVSETSIRIGIAKLYEGDYAVQVLFNAQENAKPMACGDVPDETP